MELNKIFRLGLVNGSCLNSEEQSGNIVGYFREIIFHVGLYIGLEVAILMRKLQENLVGQPLFWGKIFGSTQDYLIVQHVDPYSEFPDKKFYFW